jgi:hypothetical protein
MTSGRMRVPGYGLHKASGQAVVRLNGKDHYLGKHGSDESQARYEVLIATWLQNGRQPVALRGRPRFVRSFAMPDRNLGDQRRCPRCSRTGMFRGTSFSFVAG